MIAVTKIVNKLLKNIFFALTNLTSSNYLDTTKYLISNEIQQTVKINFMINETINESN